MRGTESELRATVTVYTDSAQEAMERLMSRRTGVLKLAAEALMDVRSVEGGGGTRMVLGALAQWLEAQAQIRDANDELNRRAMDAAKAGK